MLKNNSQAYRSHMLFVNPADKRYNTFVINNTKKADLYNIRSLIVMVVSFAAITLIFGVFGIFYTPLIWILWASSCAFFTVTKVITFSRPSRECIFYALISVFFSLVIAFFTVPTIFSGRDQGAIAQAAMQLATTHGLIAHSPESTVFFDIYGTGKALNFPGFFYTADGGLLTQFPLPYITYLAGFFGMFGVAGLIAANSILLTLFVLSITYVARTYLTHKYTIIFLLLLLSSFAIGWFAKFTLSENLASALLWSSIFLYIILKKIPSKTTYFTLIITLSLLLFSRIEGVWFFGIFLFLIIRDKKIRTFLAKDLWWRCAFPLATLFTVACVVTVMNTPFIQTMLSVFVQSVGPDATAETETLTEKITNLFSIYTIYGLFGPLFVTVCMSIAAVRYKKLRPMLLPVAITLPLFAYYLFPHISGDHPWMLRRFVFALIPTTILVSTFFVSIIPQKKIIHTSLTYIIICALFFANIPAFTLFITYAENSTLQKQIRFFSQRFSQNDLILVDKNVAGNGWSMITGPLRSLENKHAVYFFNPYDYFALNTDQFDHVYLITANENIEHYTEILSEYMYYKQNYTFIVDQLQLEKIKNTPRIFPMKENRIIYSTIYELKKTHAY